MPGGAGELVLGAASLVDAGGGGLGRYTEGVATAMLARAPDLRVVTASERLARAHPRSVAPIRTPLVGRCTPAGNLARLAWHQTVLAPVLRRWRAGAFLSTVAEGMLRPPCPQVVTLHDTIPLVHPELFGRLALVFRHLVPRLIRASAAVVAVSESTRRDLERFYPDALEGREVHVVYQGYREDTFRRLAPERVAEVRRRYGLGRYLLAVGEARPYKNFRRLVEAFAALPPDGTELAVVGRRHKDDPGLEALPAALGAGDRVRFLGFVPDADLAALYNGAEALVFPSTYEGFGIPPLEAMACGCPVVCSRTSSLPEVCGEAALYVDPLRTEDLARGIAALTRDPALREELRERGRERAKGFSFAGAAERLLQIMEGVRR